MSRQLGASKNRKYSPSKLETAVRMVESGTLSRKKAALTFGVPRTTLIDKLSGRYKLGSMPGRNTVLSKAEELTLVEYCLLMASIGYPLKKNELLFEVKKVLDHDQRPTPFKNNLHGKDWFYGFTKRHPDVSQRTAMTLGNQRAMINKDMIDGWFVGLETFLKKEVSDWETMIKDPRRCLNADESGFPLCVNTGKVLAKKGARHVYQVSSSTKQQLTVMACFNAFGDYVPPLILFPGERFRDSGIHEFPEAIYGHTPNGWMDSALFVEFLKHLDTYITQKSIPKPIILYVDGHSTHMSLDAATFCHENDIVLYCLFPNATHVLQPCDVGFFGPMKSAWKKEVKEWHLENVGQSFTKRSFPCVFKKAWLRVAKLENAIHGFQRCGLYPLCSDNVDISKLTPSMVHAKRNLPETTASPMAILPETRVSTMAPLPETMALAVPPLPETTASDVPPLPESMASIVSPLPVTMASTMAPLHETTASIVPPLPGTTVSTMAAPLPETTASISVVPVFSTSQSACVSEVRAIGVNLPLQNASSEANIPGPTGACNPCVTTWKVPSPNIIKDKDSYVSPSFSMLNVPEIRPKKPVNSIRQKLPKALSGSDALKMLKDREIKKREEEEAKLKRKKERALKKLQREEEKLQRKKEREQKQKIKEELKKSKDQNKSKASKKRKLDESSSSESDTEAPKYAESDDDYDEKSLCPGCLTDDGDHDEWVSCTSCPRKWHISCTGDAVLFEITAEQMEHYPFMCENCVEK